MRSGFGGLIWLIVGVIVAASDHYLANVGTFKLIGSALLAIILWPLLLLGINLHIR